MKKKYKGEGMIRVLQIDEIKPAGWEYNEFC